MPRTLPSRRHRVWRRPAGVWIAGWLVVVSLVGHFELHVHAQGHDTLSPAVLAGPQLELGEHIEAPASQAHRDCPACHLKLSPREVSQFASLSHGSFSPLITPRQPTPSSSLHGSASHSRGPPAAA